MNNAKNAIDKIKTAEEKANATIKNAQNCAQKAILDAKLEAKEIIFWAEVDAIAASYGILSEARSEITAELDKISKNTQEEKQELEKKAKDNLSRTVNFILDEFLKSYGNSKA